MILYILYVITIQVNFKKQSHTNRLEEDAIPKEY